MTPSNTARVRFKMELVVLSEDIQNCFSTIPLAAWDSQGTGREGVQWKGIFSGGQARSPPRCDSGTQAPPFHGLASHSWSSSPARRGPRGTQEVHEPDGEVVYGDFHSSSPEIRPLLPSWTQAAAAGASAAPEDPVACGGQVLSFHSSVVSTLKLCSHVQFQ